MPDCITSLQNPLIKRLCKLREKARFRRKENSFLVEGLREVKLAISKGYHIEVLIFARSIISEKTVQKILSKQENCKNVFITPTLYEKIAIRGSTEGIIGVFKIRVTALKNLVLEEKPIVLVAEGVEKPGNIGAILRTADALGVDAVLLADTKIDRYNPQLIRASLGAAFTVPMIAETTQNIQCFLGQQRLKIYAATLTKKSKYYTNTDFANGGAIVVGAESTGLSKAWTADKNITQIQIPIRGTIDSMNVSVAAGILMAEAIRQKNND